MRFVGRVIHAFGRRMVIVQCSPARLPRMYAEVVDRQWKTVGIVVELFGNTGSPCAAVLCRDGCRVSAGEKLFERLRERKNAGDRKDKNPPVGARGT